MLWKVTMTKGLESSISMRKGLLGSNRRWWPDKRVPDQDSKLEGAFIRYNILRLLR